MNNFTDLRYEAMSKYTKSINASEELTSKIHALCGLYRSYTYKEDVTKTYENMGFSSSQELLQEELISKMYNHLNETHKKIFCKYLELAPKLGAIRDLIGYTRGYRTVNIYHNLSPYFEMLCNLFAYEYINFDLLKFLNGEEYFSYEPTSLGLYYACVLSLEEGNEVYEYIKNMIYNSENLINISNSLIRGLLQCHRAGARELVLDLLKAAKLSEGLRSSIVSQIDLGSLDTYKYFLEYIRKDNLMRFSSVKNSFLMFTGLTYDVSDKSINYISEYVYECLLDRKTLDYLQSDNALKFYIGLYSLGCEEFSKALDYIENNFLGISDYKKAVCLLFMGKSSLKITASAINEALSNIDDINLFNVFLGNSHVDILFNTDHEKREFITLFCKLIKNLKTKDFEYTLLDEYTVHKTSPSEMYSKVLMLTDEIKDLYEVVYPFFDKYALSYRYNPYTEIKHPIMKEALITSLCGNQRKFAAQTIDKLNLSFTKEEYLNIANNFKSKRSDVRKYVSEILCKADDEILLYCAEMLLKDKKIEKRNGAISILIDSYEQIKNNKEFAKIKEILKETDISEDMLEEKNILLDEKVKKESNCIYDINYSLQIPSVEYTENLIGPKSTNVLNKILNKENPKNNLSADDVILFVEKAYNIFAEHIGEEIEVENISGNKKTVKIGYDYSAMDIGGIVYQKKTYKDYLFYDDYIAMANKITNEELVSLWVFIKLLNKVRNLIDSTFSEEMYVNGVIIGDLVHKLLLPDLDLYKISSKVQEYKLWNNVLAVIDLLIMYKEETTGISIFYECQDLMLDFLGNVIKYEQERLKDVDSYYENLIQSSIEHIETKSIRCNGTVKNNNEIMILSYFSDIFDSLFNEKITYKDTEKAHDIFLNFCNMTALNPMHITIEELFRRVHRGEIEKDYVYQLIFEKNVENILTLISHQLSREKLKDNHGIMKLKEEIYFTAIDYMLGAELERTEKDTDYSSTLKRCHIFKGSETFIKAIFKMGKMPFCRSYYYGDSGKKEMFSHIISNTYVEDDLTNSKFNSLLSEYKITEQKLLEGSMYNLRFMPYTENYLNIQGLTKGAYFFKAHMNDYFSEKDIKLIGRYTDIDITDLCNGQMDIKWFKESYEELGEENFQKLYNAAKYITDGAKHKRAQYFTDALRGNLLLEEVESRIDDKRNQDMILAFGLIPLKNNKLKDALDRYKRLQRFLKESKQYGAQRRQSEALKVSIAINNLARNYGVRDSNRFIWSMETELIENISEFFIPKKIDNIEVYISLENIQSPKIVVSSNDKILKSVPSKYNKDPYIKDLKESVKDLKDQYSRAKNTLENSMVYEDEFLFEEIEKLQNHPIISSILKDLLFVCNENIGILKENSLVDYNGKAIPLSEKDTIRIAHAVDLLEKKCWVQWQEYFMANGIVQQFKQVFRELYTMTLDEESNAGYTNRFAGYQIDGKRMLGILKSRGWVLNNYDGFEKINHKENIRIDLYSYADWYTPAEIESPTIEEVRFVNNKTNKAANMKDLSKILYSETMRDLDLVVSVAYVGGVDPLLNHTTIEMRKKIIEHNLKLFKINNYKLEEKHISIEGKLGSYSIHLGSGTIHVKGKGMLPVFPVHSQQRGHIFLPFVDEDPKTSEIISKILMLAKDHTIKDPSVLVHLR